MFLCPGSRAARACARTPKRQNPTGQGNHARTCQSRFPRQTAAAPTLVDPRPTPKTGQLQTTSEPKVDLSSHAELRLPYLLAQVTHEAFM